MLALNIKYEENRNYLRFHWKTNEENENKDSKQKIKLNFTSHNNYYRYVLCLL